MGTKRGTKSPGRSIGLADQATGRSTIRRVLLGGLCSALVFSAWACSSGGGDTGSSPEESLPPTIEATISAQAFQTPPIGAATTYQGKGFAIDYPKNWKVTEKSGDCKLDVCITAPAQAGQVPAILGVSVYYGYADDYDSPENLQTAWNQIRQFELKSSGVDPETVPDSQGDTTLAGLPGRTATYTLDWGLIPATATQTMTIRGKGPAYIVTVMSATDIWGAVQPVAEDALASFALT